VLTGQEQLDVALRVQGAGAADYLQKGELTPGLTGRPLRWAAQRSRMQQKLRQRDAWIRSITESLSVGVFRTGPKGHVKYANEALAEMLGFESGEEMVGRDLTGFYAQRFASRERMAASLSVCSAQGRPTTGRGGWSTTMGRSPTFITARKEKEERLRVLSEAAQQAKEAVVITEAAPLDEPGPRIEHVNEAFEEMTGYAEEEVLGKTPRILQGPNTDREAPHGRLPGALPRRRGPFA